MKLQLGITSQHLFYFGECCYHSLEPEKGGGTVQRWSPTTENKNNCVSNFFAHLTLVQQE